MRKLIISKVNDRLKFMIAIRNMFGYPLKEAKKLTNNLPVSFDNFYGDHHLLDGNCDYTIHETVDYCKYREANEKRDLEYAIARRWYESLSDFDKSMVDILTSGVMPRA